MFSANESIAFATMASNRITGEMLVDNVDEEGAPRSRNY